MRVKELTLHNFRGIKDLHLVFNTQHNVVVLVGVNGVGKSSILECISLFIEKYQILLKNSYRVREEYRQEYIDESLISRSDIQIGTSSTINRIKLFLQPSCEIEYEIARFSYPIDQENTPLDSPTWKKYNRRIQESITNVIEKLTINYSFYYLSNRSFLDLSTYNGQDPEDIVDFKDFSDWFEKTENLENERRLSDNIE